MRPTLALPLALVAVLALAGCKLGTLFGDGEDLSSKKAALEAVVKKAEEEATALAAKVAEAAAETEAKAKADAGTAEKAEAPAGDEVAAGEDAKEKPIDHVSIFEERLAKAGFGPLTIESLLPDLLGGLEACEAPLRTKLHIGEDENAYATLAQYPDAKAANACFKEYLTMPGASKYAHLYTLSGPYMLELHPRMEAKDMNKIRAEFTATLKDAEKLAAAASKD
ncbi:MAG TPA: hypothetical protein VGD74_08495 [Vulgatibacter sp.]